MTRAAALLLLAAAPALAQTTTPIPPTPAVEPAAPAPLPAPGPAAGTHPALAAGSPAPALTVEKFIKGDAVTGLEKGKVYIVEFWATWCVPCIRMFPKLSELQAANKTKGLSVVGVNVWERGYNASTLGRVESFVERQGDKMGYTVAFDGPGRAMDKAWLGAAGRGSIPTAFLVDATGTVAMVGHPMFLEDVLPRVLAGTWDAAKDGARVVKAEEAITGKLDELMERGDLKGVVARVEEIEKDFPGVGAQLEDVKARSLLLDGQCDRAYVILAKMTDRAIAEQNAPTLNSIAWNIVDPDSKVAKRDLDLALRAAEKAVEFSRSADASIIDTLARVHFDRGDRARAIELQKQAVEKAPAAKKDQFRDTLAEYEDAKK